MFDILLMCWILTQLPRIMSEFHQITRTIEAPSDSKNLPLQICVACTRILGELPVWQEAKNELFTSNTSFYCSIHVTLCTWQVLNRQRPLCRDLSMWLSRGSRTALMGPVGNTETSFSVWPGSAKRSWRLQDCLLRSSADIHADHWVHSHRQSTRIPYLWFLLGYL